MGELNVVGMEDIDVVESQAGEALVDAAGDAGVREVKALILVAAALGGDDNLVPRDSRVAKAVAEDRLRDGATVVPVRSGEGLCGQCPQAEWGRRKVGRGVDSVRGGVEEVDAEVERAADGSTSGVAGHVPEDVAERGGTKANRTDAEACAAQLTELHAWDRGE